MQAFVQLHPILKKGIDVRLKELFFTNSGTQNFCRARIADDDGSQNLQTCYPCNKAVRCYLSAIFNLFKLNSLLTLRNPGLYLLRMGWGFGDMLKHCPFGIFSIKRQLARYELK